jgi:RNA polymerase sigma-70 factor, ECF subfamily
MDSERAIDSAMERYADGDASAFAVVHDALAPQLLSFLRRRAGDQAEDILQQTFFQMHLARGSFIRGAPVRAWAYAIARRLIIDRQRREKTVARARAILPRDWLLGGLDAPPDETVVAYETACALASAYVRMPASQRAAFDLLRDGGVSSREAAGILGTTVAAVRLRTSRAVRALRRILTAGGGKAP